jgi:beta-phosphoglucomutase
VRAQAGRTKAVLWDLDGTLVDSEEYHWRAWREAIAAEGVGITRPQFLATFGQRNDAIVPQLLGMPVDPARVGRIGDAKEVRYRGLVKEGGLAPLPGVALWLARLKEDGWLQAVASSAPRLNVEVVLEAIGLAGMFQAIVSAEDVHRGKPDPEVFLAAAARLGVEPARSIVVEDAAAGVEAARRAGMRSIGVRDTLREADLAVASLTDLPRKAFDELLAP